jgi:hypothetical protein
MNTHSFSCVDIVEMYTFDSIYIFNNYANTSIIRIIQYGWKKLPFIYLYFRNVDVLDVSTLRIRCKPILSEMTLKFSEVQFYTNQYTIFRKLTANLLLHWTTRTRFCYIPRGMIWNQKGCYNGLSNIWSYKIIKSLPRNTRRVFYTTRAYVDGH